MSNVIRTTESRHAAGSGDDSLPLLLSASTLDGNDVYNLKEENLGSIKDIMLDVRGGTVSYAVLSSGGFLGIGDRLFAIPWRALTLDTENKRFVLDVDAERLKNAPGFDKEHWPNMADSTWAESIRSYYAIPPTIANPNAPPM